MVQHGRGLPSSAGYTGVFRPSCVRFRLAVFLRIFQAESSNSSDSCRSGGSSGMLIYAIILWVPGAFTEVQVGSSAVH